MTFIRTTPPEQASGPVEDMYRRQQRAFGYLPNYAKVFCHRPDILQLWADLQRGIQQHMDRRRYELITLAAAHTLRSSYCALAHGKASLEYFSAEDIRAIVVDAGAGILSEAETVMVQFARKVAKDATQVTAGDVAVLKHQGFSDEEVFDIVSVAAARAFFTKLVDGLGAEADTAYLEMEEGLRKSLTVGRPIAFRD